MKVLVRDMSAELLNYCAADLTGSVMHHEVGGTVKVNGRIFNPCEKWSDCGPLLSHLLSQDYCIQQTIFSGSIKVLRSTGDRVVCSFGATPQIAIVRAYVALKRGPEAEVPDDLVKTVEVAQA